MQQPSKDDQRNLILAAVLSFAVIALWQFLVISPQVEEQRRAAELAAIEEQARLEESGEAAVTLAVELEEPLKGEGLARVGVEDAAVAGDELLGAVPGRARVARR